MELPFETRLRSRPGARGQPSSAGRFPGASSRSVVLAAVLLVTFVRSAVFVFWEGAHFDPNQAVIGLMGKHMAEGRAFPVFMYGQNYMLAVQAWLAAPLFAVGGVSVTALKLPLLAINLATAWLLFRLLADGGRLPPLAVGLATVFFVLPGPGTTARLLEASGGTVEPFLYVLLLWILRDRPAWFGLVLGIGVLHREFTAYGFASLLVIDTLRGRLLTRAGLRRTALVLAVAVAVFAVVQAARLYGPAMGPGTTPADLRGNAQVVVEVANRLCIDWGAVPRGYLDIARVHWPLLFSTAEVSVREFGVESDVVQGVWWGGAVLGLAMLLAAARVAMRLAAERRWHPEHDIFAYLLLIATASVSAYVLTRCGVITPSKMRYDLLSILGAVGLAAWFLSLERSRWLKATWLVLVLAWVFVVARPHARLLTQYLSDAPIGGKRAIVSALEERNVRYAISTYALAYPISFLSGERIVVACSNRVRILAYEREYRAHRAEAVKITRTPCRNGEKAFPGVYLCPP